jgi:hypothetical protein
MHAMQAGRQRDAGVAATSYYYPWNLTHARKLLGTKLESANPNFNDFYQNCI